MSEFKAKAVALKALLKNKDIARQIFDAVKAPHGSTKQKTAARLLRSVGRFSDNKFNDGQGGPGLPMAGPMQAPAMQKPLTAPRLPMAGARMPAPAQPAAPLKPEEQPEPQPPSSIAYGIDDLVPNLMSKSQKTPAQASSSSPVVPTRSPVMVPPPFDFSLAPKTAYAAEVGRNGSYSQGEVDQMFMQCVQAGGKAMACALKGKESTGMMVSWQTAKQWSQQSLLHTQSAVSTKEVAYPPISGKQPATPTESATGTPPTGSATGTPLTGSASGTPPTGMTGSASGTDMTGSGSSTGQVPGGATSNTNKTENTTSTETPTGDGSGSTGDEAGDIFYSAGTTDIMRMWKDAVEGKTGDAAVDEWMKELQKRDPNAHARFLPIYNNFKARTGGAGAALDLMTDPDQLAVTIGVPKEFFDKLPWDIFGGPKLADLRNTARKSANLDQMESELKDRQTSHLYADETFKNYVLGKDEYLNKVDTMIHEYDDYLRATDRSDPRTRRMMQNYRNYLITLKGATQQKYINLINQSIKLESADYQRFYTMYQTAAAEAKALEGQLVSQANSSWKTMVPLITQSIQSMYDHLGKLGTASLDSFKQYAESYTSAAKAAKEVLGAANERSETVTDAQGNKITTKTSTVNGVTTTTVTKKDPQGNVTTTSTKLNANGTVADHGPKTVTSFEGENNEIMVKTTTTVAGGVTKVDIKKYDKQGKLIDSKTATEDAQGNLELVNVYKPITKAVTDQLYTTIPTAKVTGVPGKLTTKAVYDIAAANNVDPKLLFQSYVKALQESIGAAISGGNFSELSSYLAPLRDTTGIPPEDAAVLGAAADAFIVTTVPPALVQYLKTPGPSAGLEAALKDLGSGKGGFDWGELGKRFVTGQTVVNPLWWRGLGGKELTKGAFIKKHEKTISPVVLGLLWDANESPQDWIMSDTPVEKEKGYPFGWAKEDWDDLIADQSKLMQEIFDGTGNYLTRHPDYDFK